MNVIVGVVYRAHTSIDDFIKDIEPIYKKLNSEKKHFYEMGDFNIDLLETDSHRPIHDYLEFIYSHSMLPTIYKPTRITATTATCIDNILTNNEDIIQSTILISNITDHFPTILSSNLDVVKQKICENKSVYKRNHCDDNINKFEQRLSDVTWQDVLNNNDANDDYNKFVKTFEIIYDECIPLKKCKVNKKKYHYHLGLRKGCLKV